MWLWFWCTSAYGTRELFCQIGICSSTFFCARMGSFGKKSYASTIVASVCAAGNFLVWELHNSQMHSWIKVSSHYAPFWRTSKKVSRPMQREVIKRYSKSERRSMQIQAFSLMYMKAWLNVLPAKCNEDKKSLYSYANIVSTRRVRLEIYWAKIGNRTVPLFQKESSLSLSFSRAANLRFSCPHVKAVSSSKNCPIVQSLTSVPSAKEYLVINSESRTRTEIRRSDEVNVTEDFLSYFS